jgi:predicted DNA repair protein MutK
MAFSGLIAMLDDIATIADDVATLSLAATKKTSGIVTDDMAVTAEQAIGIAREREIPVVLKVARGSLLNKALILAPGALVLSAVAPWSITPLLMAGGAYLAFEGVEKIIHKFQPHGHHRGDDKDHDGVLDEAQLDPVEFENQRVSGAIRTDLILSGEIIAITLGEITQSPFVTRVGVLYGVSLIMTVGVYGTVAGLVKIDDLGEWMVRSGGGSAAMGKLIVKSAPWILHGISWIGTMAMLMVGGHIWIEGVHPLEEFVHHWLHELPAGLSTVVGMLVDMAVGAVVGLVVVGLMATGIPGRLWALVPKPGRRKS